MNFFSILFPQTIYKTTSKFSGEIRVVDHVFERRLVVGGLTQSGGITKKIWERALREFKTPRPRSAKRGGQNSKLKIKNVLILGLGAGTVAHVINKKWPEAKIVGIEIDPTVIDVGKKHFQLDETGNLKIIIADAIAYINSEAMKQLNNFDLIIVDLYKGKKIEENIENEAFIQKIAQNLAKNGVVIFNVIASQNANFEATIFLDKLYRIFKDNFCKRIIVNNFFFCAKPFFTKGGELSMAKKRKRKKRR